MSCTNFDLPFASQTAPRPQRLLLALLALGLSACADGGSLASVADASSAPSSTLSPVNEQGNAGADAGTQPKAGDAGPGGAPGTMLPMDASGLAGAGGTSGFGGPGGASTGGTGGPSRGDAGGTTAPDAGRITDASGGSGGRGGIAGVGGAGGSGGVGGSGGGSVTSAGHCQLLAFEDTVFPNAMLNRGTTLRDADSAGAKLEGSTLTLTCRVRGAAVMSAAVPEFTGVGTFKIPPGSLRMWGQTSDRECSISVHSIARAVEGFLACPRDPAVPGNIFAQTGPPVGLGSVQAVPE